MPPVRLAGHVGFRFAAEADGARVTYYFLSISDRTLLLVKRRSEELNTTDPAVQSVMDSLRFPDTSLVRRGAAPNDQ